MDFGEVLKIEFMKVKRSKIVPLILLPRCWWLPPELQT